MVKNIIIVGGGGAGAEVALALAPSLDPAKHNLILINERPFSMHMPAGVRTVVTDEGKFEDKMFYPLDKFFRDKRPGRFIHGHVDSIDETSVHLDDGTTLPYDALVLATGNTWRGPLNFPTTVEKNAEWLVTWRAKFKRASKVAIIGGGAVGLELAGEIKDASPKTEVTVVHNQRLLLNDAYTDSFRKALQKHWEAGGIRIIVDDAAVNLPEDPLAEITGPIHTAKGKTIEADVVLVMVGGRPNTGVVSTLDPTAVTSTGHVKVLDTLQVPLESGKRNVFAAGDIISWPEQKQVFKAGFHAAVVAQNLLAVLDGKPAVKKYSSMKETIVVTRGKSGGLGYIPYLCGITLPTWAVKMVKGKDLMTGMAMKKLGY